MQVRRKYSKNLILSPQNTTEQGVTSDTAMRENATRSKDIHCHAYNNKQNAATLQETRCSINKPEQLLSLCKQS